MNQLTLDQLLGSCERRLRLGRASRCVSDSGDLQRVQDVFEGARCLFVRAHTTIGVRLSGSYGLQRCAAGGWLLLARNPALPNYWLPSPAILRQVGAQGHILHERRADWDRFAIDSSGVQIDFGSVPENWSLDAVIWRLDDPRLVADLTVLAPIETRGYFMLGSHTCYHRPADLYRHAVHGWVYEDRYAWPHKRRICSENDAHALHLIFHGLQRASKKRLYRLLKAQLLLSVLSRQSEDGGYRHGEWTNGMESHFRLHCSAMHLMMDALSECDDPALRAALGAAARYVSDKHDDTRVGAWFYHDELELTATGMNAGPFKWLAGRALGKSRQNMLVLNTHLDTLIALDRYGQLTRDTRYRRLVASGVHCANAVLALRAADWLYRLVFSAVTLTLLPSTLAKRLPLWKRAWKRIGWQVFIPHLYQLKNLLPRLVMPGGYIDRHLGRAGWAFHYLTINIMDLARARRRFGPQGFDAVLHEAARFTQMSGVRERWKELQYERYALGFWAEALWHLAREFPDHPEYSEWYREACTDLEALHMGLPPSHLGVNAEASAARDACRAPTSVSVVAAATA